MKNISAVYVASAHDATSVKEVIDGMKSGIEYLSDGGWYVLITSDYFPSAEGKRSRPYSPFLELAPHLANAGLSYGGEYVVPHKNSCRAKFERFDSVPSGDPRIFVNHQKVALFFKGKEPVKGGLMRRSIAEQLSYTYQRSIGMRGFLQRLIEGLRPKGGLVIISRGCADLATMLGDKFPGSVMIDES